MLVCLSVVYLFQQPRQDQKSILLDVESLNRFKLDEPCHFVSVITYLSVSESENSFVEFRHLYNAIRMCKIEGCEKLEELPNCFVLHCVLLIIRTIYVRLAEDLVY